MAATRKIEVFSAGCPTCHEASELIRRAACPSCEVIVHDMRDVEVAERAKGLGIRSVPAVVIEGKLAGVIVLLAICLSKSASCAIIRSPIGIA